MDEEDYWNKSENKAFDFNEDESRIATGSSGGLIKAVGDRNLFLDDNISERSYEIPTNDDIPLHLIISDANLRTILEEQSMDEIPVPKSISPEDELRLLRRKMQDKYHAVPASDIIDKIIMRKPYALEYFKSLDEKVELLNAATDSGDGNAVLIIILFMIKTLKKSFIVNCLHQNPTALSQLCNYFLLRNEIFECCEWLSLLGKSNEISLIKFSKALKAREHRKQTLSKVYGDYFKKPGVSSFNTKLLSNYIQLLDLQENERHKNAAKATVGLTVDSSVLETLYYFSSQYKWIDGQLSSHKLFETFKINQAQFEWIALNERARSQAWQDLESLFEKKSWHSLSSKTFSINLPLENVVVQLFRLNAPVAVLNHFLSKVSNAQQRLVLARRCKASKSIVDALVELKNKEELEQFIQTIAVGSDTRFYAENALKTMKTKWNTDNIKLLKS